jgi:inorganic pyrophosphatase
LREEARSPDQRHSREGNPMTDHAGDALPIAPSHLAHPWHGISPGAQAPVVLTVYIEIVPTDTVKYEVDKLSGHLRVDRPQKYSALCPALYGFVPRTLCGDAVGAFAASRAGRPGVAGDGDPMDVCVLTEREINRGGIIVSARPIGGFRMFDGSEADDKILTVLEGDAAYGGFRDLGDCPPALVERLRHYFLTYKDMPGAERRNTEITHVYGAAEAREVVRYSLEDYRRRFVGSGP